MDGEAAEKMNNFAADDASRFGLAEWCWADQLEGPRFQSVSVFLALQNCGL